MATLILEPDGDIAANWGGSTGGTHWGEIDDGVVSPTVPQTATNIDDNSDLVDEFSMTSDTVGEVSSIKIYIYAENTGSGESATADIYVNGAYTGVPKDFNVQNGAAAWYNVEFVDTYDQADITALQVKLTQVSGGNNRTIVHALYAEVTHAAGGGGGGGAGRGVIGGGLI